MIRTFAHDTVLELAEYASVPVINALTDLLHPCQAMADMMTAIEYKGKDLKGKNSLLSVTATIWPTPSCSPVPN